jgi:hypothetical protein
MPQVRCISVLREILHKITTQMKGGKKKKKKKLHKVKKYIKKFNKGANYFLTTQSNKDCGTELNDMREIRRK